MSCYCLTIEKGTVFSPPLVEFFYKSDALDDPLIGETHIRQFGWATDSELKQMVEITLKVNTLLTAIFNDVGLELIDYKLEFGRNSDQQVLLADEFTPDGCRLWDKETGQPMDKDRFRQDLGGVEEAYSEVMARLKKRFAR